MTNQTDTDKAKLAAEEAEAKAKADADAKSAAEEAARKEAGKAVKRPVKADDPALTADAPYPSQADLDAMRAGTYTDRELKSR